MVCQVAGGYVQVSITSGGSVESVTEAMTMEAGGISGALANRGATGSLSVTVIGSGFGLVGVSQAG